MKKIICNINMFSMQQSVWLIDDETNGIIYSGDSTLHNLPETISALSAKYDVSRVCLNGNEEHGALLAKNILEYSKEMYSNNNLEIEVI